MEYFPSRAQPIAINNSGRLMTVRFLRRVRATLPPAHSGSPIRRTPVGDEVRHGLSGGTRVGEARCARDVPESAPVKPASTELAQHEAVRLRLSQHSCLYTMQPSCIASLPAAMCSPHDSGSSPHVPCDRSQTLYSQAGGELSECDRDCDARPEQDSSDRVQASTSSAQRSDSSDDNIIYIFEYTAAKSGAHEARAP